MLCGGASAMVEADEKIQKLSDHVRAEAEEKAGKKFPEYKAKSYKKQTVAGTNYFIKVQFCVPSNADTSVYFTFTCFDLQQPRSHQHQLLMRSQTKQSSGIRLLFLTPFSSCKLK
uniref:Cystatin domain-containing protein n=1 Tax=Mola mola TaxID=94237 RepID=A0A3Q3VR12_MOLML